MQTIADQLADIETQIAEKNKAIARMERDLDASNESLADKWFRTCSYNLKKARLDRETLERKLDKLLGTQRQVIQQEQAAIFKKKQAEANHALDLKRIAAAKVARKNDADFRQLNAIEMNNRKCIEFRRLVIPLIGEEKSCELMDQAEKLAWEWVEKRATSPHVGAFLDSTPRLPVILGSSPPADVGLVHRGTADAPMRHGQT